MVFEIARAVSSVVSLPALWRWMMSRRLFQLVVMSGSLFEGSAARERGHSIIWGAVLDLSRGEKCNDIKGLW